jgi:hypothetical protein
MIGVDGQVDGWIAAHIRARAQSEERNEPHRGRSSSDLKVKPREQIRAGCTAGRSPERIKPGRLHAIVARASANLNSYDFSPFLGLDNYNSNLIGIVLEIADIHAFPVPADDRRGVVDPTAPSLVRNHMITAIELPLFLRLRPRSNYGYGVWALLLGATHPGRAIALQRDLVQHQLRARPAVRLLDRRNS